MWEDNTEVAFMNVGQSYFNVYPLAKIEEFIATLEARKKLMSLEERREIRDLISRTYYSIIDTYTLDSQRRLMFPSEIKNTITSKQVILQGINTHISICPTPESYNELCLRYIPKK